MYDFKFGSDENGPDVAVKDDDFFEEDCMTEISELGCFRSDDPKISEYFTSADDEDLVCFIPSVKTLLLSCLISSYLWS